MATKTKGIAFKKHSYEPLEYERNGLYKNVPTVKGGIWDYVIGLSLMIGVVAVILLAMELIK